jgi:hypothetical protein
MDAVHTAETSVCFKETTQCSILQGCHHKKKFLLLSLSLWNIQKLSGLLRVIYLYNFISLEYVCVYIHKKYHIYIYMCVYMVCFDPWNQIDFIIEFTQNSVTVKWSMYLLFSSSQLWHSQLWRQKFKKWAMIPGIWTLLQ